MRLAFNSARLSQSSARSRPLPGSPVPSPGWLLSHLDARPAPSLLRPRSPRHPARPPRGSHRNFSRTLIGSCDSPASNLFNGFSVQQECVQPSAWTGRPDPVAGAAPASLPQGPPLPPQSEAPGFPRHAHTLLFSLTPTFPSPPFLNLFQNKQTASL